MGCRGRLRAVGVTLAARANPLELKAKPDNLVSRRFHARRIEDPGVHPSQVVNTATTNTANMIVPAKVAIKAALTAHAINPARQMGPHQDIQVTVHRAETDIGQTLTDTLKKLVGRGMIPGPLKFLQYDPPLYGAPMSWRLLFHLITGTITISFYSRENYFFFKSNRSS